MAATLRAAFFAAGTPIFAAAVAAAGATVPPAGVVLMVAAAVEGGIVPAAVTDSDGAGVVAAGVFVRAVSLAARGALVTDFLAVLAAFAGGFLDADRFLDADLGDLAAVFFAAFFAGSGAASDTGTSVKAAARRARAGATFS